MTLQVLTNASVLTTQGFRDRQSVVLRGGLIDAVMDDSDFDLAGADVCDLHGQLLLPGFIDVQVNNGHVPSVP